jgi:hypothetical protein
MRVSGQRKWRFRPSRAQGYEALVTPVSEAYVASVTTEGVEGGKRALVLGGTPLVDT